MSKMAHMCQQLSVCILKSTPPHYPHLGYGVVLGGSRDHMQQLIGWTHTDAEEKFDNGPHMYGKKHHRDHMQVMSLYSLCESQQKVTHVRNFLRSAEMKENFRT